MKRDTKLSIKRAANVDALFLCLLLFLSSPLLAGQCVSPSFDQKAFVKKVVDGDTLRLADGTNVRLVGVNAPEIGRKGKLSEPFAQKSRKRLLELLGRSSIVMLKKGEEPRDRYGRLLAYTFTEEGKSIELSLVEEGLGFAISVPPNLLLLDCLLQAQSEARAAKRGVWGDSYFAPRKSHHLKASDTGFRLVSGRLERAYFKKGGRWWLLMEGRLALMVSKRSQHYFSRSTLEGLVGREVVVSGWLTKRRLSGKEKAKGYKPFMMSVKHPASFVEPVLEWKDKGER